MWDFIDKIVYINLDHRQDRRDIMSKFFQEGRIPEDKIIRFPAIKHNNGKVGCILSHMEVLRIAKKNNWKNLLILEDDLEWLEFQQGYKQLEDLVSKPDWNVIMLVGWYLKYDFPRIYSAANTGAYLVNSNYYDTLLQNREDSLKLLYSYRRFLFGEDAWNADVYWCNLMSRDVWYGVYPCICRQADTYSDIANITYSASSVHGIANRNDKAKFFAPIQNAEQ